MSISKAATSQICPRRSARPSVCSSRGAWATYSILRRLRGPNLTFGKLPLGKLHIGEVAPWEIVTLEVDFWKNAFVKVEGLRCRKVEGLRCRKVEGLRCRKVEDTSINVTLLSSPHQDILFISRQAKVNSK